MSAPAGCPCRTAPSREAAMVVIARDDTGRPIVWCDPCIGPVVAALNDAGIATVASCCGHGSHPGKIALVDGREITIRAGEAHDNSGPDPQCHAWGCEAPLSAHDELRRCPSDSHYREETS